MNYDKIIKLASEAKNVNAQIYKLYELIGANCSHDSNESTKVILQKEIDKLEILSKIIDKKLKKELE